jgi:hypothetical protein
VREPGVHYSNDEALCGGDEEQIGSACAVEELIGADGARAEKDERESAEEFGGQPLGKVVHGGIVREETGGGDRTLGWRGEEVKNFGTAK